MTDPVAEVVALLKPVPSISKLVIGGGRWLVERTQIGSPFYCAVVEGRCVMTIPGKEPMMLTAGDFVLVPELHSFTLSSLEPPPRGMVADRLEVSPGTFRLGEPDAPAEFASMVGHCDFGADQKALLVSLLPEVIHVRGEGRLMQLVRMINDETRADRTARDMVLRRLLEVLLIEALRSTSGQEAPPGLLRGMADQQLAPILRRMHEDPGRGISIQALAREAAMSRSTFFERFRREVGVAPMEYAAGWRMAKAKELLRSELSTAEIAERVGYGSASAFCVAFTRYVGRSPGTYLRDSASA